MVRSRWILYLMAWNISVLLPAPVLTEEVLVYLVVVLMGGGLEEGINDTSECSVKSAYILSFPLCPPFPSFPGEYCRNHPLNQSLCPYPLSAASSVVAGLTHSGRDRWLLNRCILDEMWSGLHALWSFFYSSIVSL